MTSNSRKIKFFRQRIPSFECRPGCHDCCGPVTTSTEEIARLPVKNVAEHEAALADLSCPYLGKNGCQVYAERPLICRLFGTTPRLACFEAIREKSRHKLALKRTCDATPHPR
ncbi:MAG: YkgJ family cysteine cluster protein [Gallionellaceae bacterium]|jgi:hypothetical protein